MDQRYKEVGENYKALSLMQGCPKRTTLMGWVAASAIDTDLRPSGRPTILQPTEWCVHGQARLDWVPIWDPLVATFL